MRSKLYKLALWYIGKCNAKWDKFKSGTDVKSLDKLTYRNIEKAYLSYGADAEWQNFSRYEVLDNAVQRLAQYEDDVFQKEIRNKAIDDVLKIISEYDSVLSAIPAADLQGIIYVIEQLKAGGKNE